MLVITVQQAQAFSEFRTRYPHIRLVMVGAAAISHHVRLRRSTADVDLAVVAEPGTIEVVLRELNWSQLSRDPPHRWRKTDPHAPDARGEVVADFLPATPRILQAGVFETGPDRTVMNMTGFDLALGHIVVVPLPSTATIIEVAELPALVVLKMVAWLDKASRVRDLGDIAEMLTGALPPDDLRRWDQDHPVGRSGLDHDDQSPFSVGYELRRIVGPKHRERIEQFLARVQDPDGTPFAQMLREGHFAGDDRDARLTAQLRAFRMGLTAT
jgi:predicted nucleotidyltransferase